MNQDSSMQPTKLSVCLLVICGIVTQASTAAVHDNQDLGLVLNSVDNLIQHGQLKKAEQRLLGLLDDSGPNHRLSFGYQHRLTRMLARIYFESKLYDTAFEWAQRSHKHLNKIPGTEAELAAERREIAFLLGRIYRARGEWRQSSEFFKQSLNHNRRKPGRDSHWELNVVAQLASVLFSADDTKELAPIRTRIEQIAASNDTDNNRGRLSSDESLRGVRIYVNYVADTHSPAGAIELLTEKLGQSTDPQSHTEMWIKVASLHRQQEQFAKELQALQNATSISSNLDQDDESVTLIRSFRFAEFHRRMARSLDDNGMGNEAVKHFVMSRRLYDSMLTQIESQAADGRPRNRFPNSPDPRPASPGGRGARSGNYLSVARKEKTDALELSTLQSLRDVTYRLCVREPSSVTADVVVDVISKLLKRLQETALDADRRVFDTEMLLGSIYLRERMFDEARSLLREALDRERSIVRIPPAHDAIVQTLMVLAEAERRSEELCAAESSLREALCISQQNPETDKRFNKNVRINLGRLLVERDRQDKARLEFKQAKKLAVKAGDVRSELTSNIELANLAISRVKLANLAISRKKLAETRRIVNSSVRICERHLPEDDTQALQVRHQQALFHFLSDRARPNANDRETARRLWQNILDIQEKHNISQRARTIHYLARIRYQDWSEGLQQWRIERKKELQLQVETYEDRRMEYNLRFKNFAAELDDYRNRREAYLSTLREATKPKAANGITRTATAKVNGQDPAIAKLHATYKKLVETKRRLDIERKSLDALKPRLMSDYVNARASAKDTTDLLKQNLGQMLAEAESLAYRANELLRDAVDFDPRLMEQIKSNLDRIRRKREQWVLETE